VLHGCLELSVELDDVDGETGAFADRTVLVGRRFDLDAVEGDEGGLTESLGTKVLQRVKGRNGKTSISTGETHGELKREQEGSTDVDALDSSLLMVDNDGVDVPSEHD
jgi:hypothetical protein